MQPNFKAGDALLLVDVQNDFMPIGSLPVPDGDAVVPTLNKWIKAAVSAGVPIYASRDWHPANHASFKDEGGIWPAHCVQNTKGAAFHDDLKLPESAIVISKAQTVNEDAYSAYQGTDLTDQMNAANINRVFVAGLALDYCVKATALDARTNGFDVVLIPDGSRAITPETGAEANAEMQSAGVEI